MPPEQARGKEVDTRADIYSLGAILYEIMTLTPPVGRGGDMMAILMRVAEGKIDPPLQRSPQRAKAGWIPPELSAIAMKALAMDPADRYQAVEPLRRDVELFQEGRSVSAKQDSFHEMAWKLIKRNKGASAGVAAALLVLAVSLVFVLKAWYNTGVAHAAYLKEQEQRLKQGRDSIPSLLTAAKLLVEKRDFDAARAQVRVALDFDREHTELINLRGQLALIGQDFARAQKDLEAQAQKRPDDALTRDLLAWLPRAKANDTNSQVTLAEIFTRHEAYGLADGALQALGENAAVARQKLLTLYRQRLEKSWPGKGTLLTVTKGGFHFRGFKELTNLAPLRGLPLSMLDLGNCDKLQDLEPLRGMPITSLSLYDCVQVGNLEPLKGMPLTTLSLWGCSQVRDLGPLLGMPLISLDLGICGNVQNLDPLLGMPLTSLQLANTNVRDLGPLRGMRLTTLILTHSRHIRDLGPLKGMPLTNLDLMSCPVSDLEPLKGMPLERLIIHECGVRDLSPLKGMPLHTLWISGDSVTDLTPLQGMKLKEIALRLSRITQGLDILRGMESLRTIIPERVALPAAEFWARYDKGEFKK